MKKKILTAAIALAAICGLQATAQKPSCPQNAPCPAEAQQCRRGDAACDKPCGGPYCEVFAGLNLTDTQKAAIKQLNQDRRAKRQQCDSTRREARKQARRDYFNGVKQVLSPEQYVQFLETIVIEQPAAMRKADVKRHVKARHEIRNGGKLEKAKLSKETRARIEKRQKAAENK